jgi:hypothetical protein
MADKERSETTQNDMSMLVKQARAAHGGLDARRALEIVVDKLRSSEGYYAWGPMGEGALATWLVRLPRHDLENEQWLSGEDADLLHLCRPVDYLVCVERGDKHKSTEFVGYVREGRCTKCSREMPEDLQKKAEVQRKLHKLGMKR